MTENEKISIATTCGILHVVRAVLSQNFSKIAEVISDQEEVLWAMIDDERVHERQERT